MYRDPMGDWHWSRMLPNGWTASIADYSHSTAPPQPTKYIVYAVCRERIMTAKETFDMLADAKHRALQFALSQAEPQPKEGK